MSREIPPIGTMVKVPDVHGRIYIVGEAPGADEDRIGMPFVGASGRLLMSMLATAGIYRNHVRIANACYVRPPKNDLTKLPEVTKLTYRELLKKDIASLNPDLVIAVGAYALEVLTGLSPISSYRGTITQCSFAPIPVLPIYHPAAILRNWDMYVPTVMDIKKAARISLNPQKHLSPQQENFKLYCTPEDFVNVLRSIPSHQPVAVDIETRPKDHVITFIGVAWGENDAANIFIPSWQPETVVPVLNELESLGRRCQIIYHNAVYDMTWLYMMLHTWVPASWDTMAMHHTLQPEEEKSLKYCASIYLDLPAWKHQAGDNLALYNARDCAATYALQRVLETSLREEKLLDFYLNMVHPRIEPVVFMGCRGLRVDEDMRQKMLNELLAEKEAYEAIVSAYNINPKSPAQLQQLLYDQFKLPVQRNKKTKKPTTDAKAIKKLSKIATGEAKIFLDAFMKWKKLESSLSKDVGVEPDPTTGCVHCGYNICGTETGRFSSSSNAWDSGTNLQNRQKKYRAMFVPHKEGNVFVACDSVQAEAYVVAWIADDENLIEAFLSGKDLHVYTAAQMYGVPESAVTKEMRTIGKRIRHACNYSMSKVTLAEIMEISQAEAAELIERYHMTNPALRKVYFPNIDRLLQQQGYLITPLGRRRIFNGRPGDAKTSREAYAFIPQSTVGDLVIRALYHFYQYTKNSPIALAVQIHDENIFETPIELAREAALKLKELMEYKMEITTFTGKTRELVIPCDFKTGYNLGPYDEKTNPRGLRPWNPVVEDPADVL
jgi:DNA polymerase-1